MIQAQYKNVVSSLLAMTKNVYVLIVISQSYSCGSCQAVFANLTYTLQLHVKISKTYCITTEKKIKQYIWIRLYSSERWLFK